jgi:hypothetical protein
MILTQGNTQVYSPFGSFVVEQHDAGYLQRHIQEPPRPDLKLGKDHSLAQDYGEQPRAA